MRESENTVQAIPETTSPSDADIVMPDVKVADVCHLCRIHSRKSPVSCCVLRHGSCSLAAVLVRVASLFAWVGLLFVACGGQTIDSGGAGEPVGASGGAGAGGSGGVHVGVGGSGALSGSTGSSSGGFSGGSGTVGTGGTPPEGRCTSPSDRAGLTAEYMDGGTFPDGGTVPEGGSPPKAPWQLATSKCVGCLSDPDRDTCVVDCLRTNTAGAISNPCLGCVANQETCWIDSGCVALCLASRSAPDCTACWCGTGNTTTTHRNCAAEFEKCAGVASYMTCN